MSDSEDDFVEYGTSLEPLDEDALPRKKPFSLEDQVVRDKQGRRRFHGAFTGGFSAGFFNSVGTLEGWAPSSFKSSRAERAPKPTQRPEDFMDDEDMEEFGIAPKVLRAKEEYNERGQKRQKPVSSQGPIPGGPMLQQLLQPARDTVGAKLLRQMGWKPGQGVGPRLTKLEKRLQRRRQREASSGQQQGALSSDSSDEECSKELTFAPGDYDPFVCRPKMDCFGIGYSGLNKQPVLSRHVNLFDEPTLVMNEKNKKVSIRGQAFGVGALEEDDEDIYSREDMSQYDFSLDMPSGSDRTAQHHHTLASASDYDVLEGFVAAVGRQLARVACFPPPALPADYQPSHRLRASRFEAASGRVPARRSLGAADRAVVVGEEHQEESQEQERWHLAEAAAKLTESLPAVNTGQFRPFAGQPDKQKRYEQFLVLTKLGEIARLAHLQPLTMTDWEKERERSEFEQASRLFQPLSADMSERFVPASQGDQPTNPLAPVQHADDKDADLRAAAQMKMYGRLTRTREAWQPCSLLCKRFNIPDPVPGLGVEVVSERKSAPKFSTFEFLVAPKAEVKHEEPPVSKPPVSMIPVHVTSTTTTTTTNLSPAHLDEDVAVSGQVLEFPDPPEKVDLFKAIFLSSSEESDSEVEDSSEPVARSVTPSTQPPVADNALRNTSPPRGVFANLDLDAINAIKPDAGKWDSGKSTASKLDDVQPEVEGVCPQAMEMYGPRLPSRTLSSVPVQPSVVTPPRPSLSSIVGASLMWLERTSDTQHHKKAAKHKKHKKEKHKKKKKEKR